MSWNAITASFSSRDFFLLFSPADKVSRAFVIDPRCVFNTVFRVFSSNIKASFSHKCFETLLWIYNMICICDWTMKWRFHESIESRCPFKSIFTLFHRFLFVISMLKATMPKCTSVTCHCDVTISTSLW